MINFNGLKYFLLTSIIIFLEDDKAFSFSPLPIHLNFRLRLDAVKFTNCLILYCLPVAIT